MPDERDAFVSLVREPWTVAFAGSMNAGDVACHLATTLSPDAINARLAANTVRVARVNDRMCGFIKFGLPDTAKPVALPGDREGFRLYVAAGDQNQGIGSLLLGAALHSPELETALRVLIDVWEDNAAALRLYARFGFAPAGRLPFGVDGKVLGYDLILARPQTLKL